MKVELKEEQVLHWPKESKYNAYWTFQVFYEVQLMDGLNYPFKTQFAFNTSEKEIYYSEMLDLIPFSKINWNWRVDHDEEGNHLNFQNLKNFIFHKSFYVGQNKMGLDKPEKIFSGSLNPFEWTDEEMEQNRDLFALWWKDNYISIRNEIIQSKEDFNNQLLTQAKKYLIK